MQSFTYTRLKMKAVVRMNSTVDTMRGPRVLVGGSMKLVVTPSGGASAGTAEKKAKSLLLIFNCTGVGDILLWCARAYRISRVGDHRTDINIVSHRVYGERRGRKDVRQTRPFERQSKQSDSVFLTFPPLNLAPPTQKA